MDKTRTLLILCLITVMGHLTTTGSDVTPTSTADPMVHLMAVAEDLSRQVSNLSAQVAGLETKLASQQTTLDSLNGQLQRDDHLISNLSRQMTQKAHQLNDLNRYSKDHIRALTSRVSALEKPVAFTVRFNNDNVDRNQTIHFHHTHVLLFDMVQYNTGGSNYNITTGRFTAPSAGTYAFFLSTQRNAPSTDQCLEMSVVRNNHLPTGCVTTACPPGYTAASSACMVWLRQGDFVYVESKAYQQIFGYLHTTFSGMKL